MPGDGDDKSVPKCPAIVRRPISRRRRLLFIAVILSFLFVVQELFCRWLFPVPEVEGFNRIDYTPLQLFSPEFSAAKQRGLSNVKIRWESEPDGFAFDHTLNLYGFRGPDFKIARDGKRSRVLFIGDSFVEGCGVSDDDTIPHQFTRAFKAEDSIEAINLGVNGAGFPEYARLVRDAVELLRPDAVFVVVYANDLPAPGIPESLDHPAPRFERLPPALPRAIELLSRYFSGLSVPRRFAGGPYPFFEPVPSETNPLSERDPPDNIDPSILAAMRAGRTNPWNAGTASLFERMLRFDFAKGRGADGYLKHMAAICKTCDCRLIVAYMPHPATINPVYVEALCKFGGPQVDPKIDLQKPPYRNQQTHLRQACAGLGIPFLDSTDLFAAADGSPDRLFWPLDGHCNAKGYRMFAEMCAQYWVHGDVHP